MNEYFILEDLYEHGIPQEGVSFPTEELALEAAVNYWEKQFSNIHFSTKWQLCDRPNFTQKIVLAELNELDVSIGFVFKYLSPIGP